MALQESGRNIFQVNYTIFLHIGVNSFYYKPFLSLYEPSYPQTDDCYPQTDILLSTDLLLYNPQIYSLPTTTTISSL